MKTSTVIKQVLTDIAMLRNRSVAATVLGLAVVLLGPVFGWHPDAAVTTAIIGAIVAVGTIDAFVQKQIAQAQTHPHPPAPTPAPPLPTWPQELGNATLDVHVQVDSSELEQALPRLERQVSDAVARMQADLAAVKLPELPGAPAAAQETPVPAQEAPPEVAPEPRGAVGTVAAA